MRGREKKEKCWVHSPFVWLDINVRKENDVIELLFKVSI